MEKEQFIEKHGQVAWKELVEKKQADPRWPFGYLVSANTYGDADIKQFLKTQGFESTNLTEAKAEYEQAPQKLGWEDLLERTIYSSENYEQTLQQSQEIFPY